MGQINWSTEPSESARELSNTSGRALPALDGADTAAWAFAATAVLLILAAGARLLALRRAEPRANALLGWACTALCILAVQRGE